MLNSLNDIRDAYVLSLVKPETTVFVVSGVAQENAKLKVELLKYIDNADNILDYRLAALESTSSSHGSKITTLESDVANLQEHVSELSENDANQETRIGVVESQSNTNRDNIEQLFGLAYGNSNEISGLSYTVDQARGADVTAAIDSDFKLTIQLVNSAGHAINQGVTIDLPLEEFVVSGVYDEESKSLVLTLKDGKTLSIPIGDLVEGLISDSQKGVANGVASLDENGKVPAEQLPESTGGGLPEGFNPEDYVKFTDIATEGKVGVVRSAKDAYGFVVTLTGAPSTDVKSLNEYKNGSVAMFVGKGTLENIKNTYVKEGITTNTETLTDEDQTKACDWLGAVKQSEVSAASVDDKIVRRITNGNINVPINPLNNHSATSKQYVDNGFVPKRVTGTGNAVYTTMYDSNTQTYTEGYIPYASAASSNTIAYRGPNGVLRVGEPTDEGHATTKKYVDAIESTVSITIEGTSTENYTANVPAYRKNDPFAYIGAVCDGDDNHVIIGYSVIYSKFILRDLETGETFKCESWNINE